MIKTDTKLDRIIGSLSNIDKIMDKACEKLDKLKSDIVGEECRRLFIEGEDYSHLLEEGYFIFWDDFTLQMRSMKRKIEWLAKQ